MTEKGIKESIYIGRELAEKLEQIAIKKRRQTGENITTHILGKQAVRELIEKETK